MRILLPAQAHVLQEEVTEKFRALWQLSNKIRKQPTDAVPTELGQLGEAPCINDTALCCLPF